MQHLGKYWKQFLGLLVIILIFNNSYSWSLFGLFSSKKSNTPAPVLAQKSPSQPKVQSSSDNLVASEKDVISVFKSVAPYVVNVHNVQAALTSGFDVVPIQRSAGSGFVWNQQGYVVTNYHVIRGANKIIVTINKQNYPANVIGAEFSKDIAVLKIQDSKDLSKLLPTKQFPVADASKLQVGQTAIAIGNPFGLDHTLTKGVVSALNRDIPGLNNTIMRGMIQTDASINPGNSGGPLLDSQGRLIGMNTLIITRSGLSSGLGFAVPSNDVERIVNKIIIYGKVIESSLGIIPLSDRLATQLKIKGIVIEKIFSNSLAEHAGLHGITRNDQGHLMLGDVITEIDNKSVNNLQELYDALSLKKNGDPLTVTYYRSGKMYQAKMTWQMAT